MTTKIPTSLFKSIAWIARVTDLAAAAGSAMIGHGAGTVKTALDATAKASDLAATGGAALVGSLQTGVGAVLRTLQDKSQDTISLFDYMTPAERADARGGALTLSMNAALAKAKAAVDLMVYANEASIPWLLVPNGKYKLTADASLPRRVRCEGQFVGNFNITFANVKRCHVLGLKCEKLKLSGVWYSNFDDTQVSNGITVDGGGAGWGTFWNVFTRLWGNVAIDLSNFSVNHNSFHGRGGLRITGGGAGSLDGHANDFTGWDTTTGDAAGGIINSSTLQQDNLIFNHYYEAGADIVGPFNVVGFHGDAGGPPRIARGNHAMFGSNVIERNGNDFLGLASANLIQGGEWDWLDGVGKPVGVVTFGVAGTVVADSNEPSGVGSSYGAVFNTTFSGFSLTVPASKTGRFAAAIYFQGPDFVSFEVDRGGGDITSGGASSVVVDTANNWKLLRISGKAKTNAATGVRLFARTGDATPVTIRLGGMFVTQEKAALLPAPRKTRKLETNTLEAFGQYDQWGEVAQGYVSGAAFVDLVINFPKPYSAAPTLTYSFVDNGGFTANMTKNLIVARTINSATVRVYYAPEWAGNILWRAIGPK